MLTSFCREEREIDQEAGLESGTPLGSRNGVYYLTMVPDEDGDGVVDDDTTFDTVMPPGVGTELAFTTADTAGCSCEQIIEERGLGVGQRRLGCTTGVMQSWDPSVGDVPPDRIPLTVIQSGDDSSVEPTHRRIRGTARERARRTDGL